MHHNVGFVLIIANRVLVGFIVVRSDVLLTSKACPVQSLCWALTIIQCFVKVVIFFFKQLLIGTDCPSPVFEDGDNTVFGRQMVVTVPLQLQICVCGVPQKLLLGVVRLRQDYCVQERKGPIWFGILSGELDVWVHGVNMLQELLLSCRLNDHKSTIHISLPNSGRIFS